MKSIKNTSINCGLLSAPVKIFSAAGQEPEVQFNYCTSDGDPVERVYIPQEDEPTLTDDGKRIVEVIDYDDLHRSYEGTKLDRTDLDNAIEDSLTDEDGNDLSLINVEYFVPLKDIPMERATKLYYLGPQKKVSPKSFEIFKRGLKKRKVAAIAKVVLRSRQMILAIYVKDDIVHASVLNFMATMNNREDTELSTDIEPRKQEVDAMGDLIDALTEDSSVIDEIEDTYVLGKRKLVEDLISGEKKPEKKAKGKTKPSEDLMSSLEASVAAAKKRRSKV